MHWVLGTLTPCKPRKSLKGHMGQTAHENPGFAPDGKASYSNFPVPLSGRPHSKVEWPMCVYGKSSSENSHCMTVITSGRPTLWSIQTVHTWEPLNSHDPRVCTLHPLHGLDP